MRAWGWYQLAQPSFARPSWRAMLSTHSGMELGARGEDPDDATLNLYHRIRMELWERCQPL